MRFGLKGSQPIVILLVAVLLMTGGDDGAIFDVH